MHAYAKFCTIRFFFPPPRFSPLKYYLVILFCPKKVKYCEGVFQSIFNCLSIDNYSHYDSIRCSAVFVIIH